MLPAPPARVSATTISGGVDSLATIRANRLDVPPDHPRSVRDAFFVLGMNTFDLAAGSPDPARARDFAARLERWGPLAREARLRVVPVVSNVRSLAASFPSWTGGMIGASLAGLAHAFAGRVARMLVPTAGGADPLTPDSCHPMLLPFYSSSAIDVETDGQGMSRMEKLRLVAGWPAALAVLEPCQQQVLLDDAINCGRCNKCHRTMVALEALGRLADATSFPRRAVDAAFLGDLVIGNEFDVQCHGESAALFRESGRHDMARALERRVAAWRRRRRWRALRRKLRPRRPGRAGTG
jgi:hypothetical protein